MVMMFVIIVVLVAGRTVVEPDLGAEAAFAQQFQRPVDRGKPYARMRLLYHNP
jgi:hypothetical protein